MRVLVLGGTGEGRALATRLAREPGLEVTTSLAGRVADPRRPPGDVRSGGFGGVDGLAAYLIHRRVEAVVDATHPFASRMTGNAVAACGRLGVPLLVLRRPGWVAAECDDWWRVPDAVSAASAVTRLAPEGATVLLTLGRGGVAAFAGDDARHYVIRSVDPPDGALPPRRTLLAARGPFTPEAERAVFREHAVAVLVTKDSGGDATAAKLITARDAGLAVVMIDRPPLPEGARVTRSVAGAVAWVLGRSTGPSASDSPERDIARP